MNPTKKELDWLLEEKYGGTKTPAYEEDAARLASGEPLAYVIGSQPFLGLQIFLDSHPLIPRPETEWWAEKLITKLLQHPKKPLKILDLCAGSGAIGCALLKSLPQAHVSFGEIDPSHRATIQKNIFKNNLDALRADIRIGDVFKPFFKETFDIIAVNPPYIPDTRKLEESVSRFEPHEALFSGKDGLDLIHRIATEAPEYLKPGGELWLECDSEHASETEACLGATAKRTELYTDQYGRSRLIVAYY
ncbi:MAG: peptide chain release factor N(5)-glutamine methyltransferase [Minisyncoccia bacterium]